MGSTPSELSIVSVTSARPSGERPDVPAKMTSSIFPPRRAFAPCSPSTQLMASTTLDLPEPFGPTTQVMPGSNRSVVDEANDLKPFRVRLLRCTPPLPRLTRTRSAPDATRALRQRAGQPAPCGDDPVSDPPDPGDPDPMTTTATHYLEVKRSGRPLLPVVAPADPPPRDPRRRRVGGGQVGRRRRHPLGGRGSARQ